jgi:pyridoxine 5-phosphate synthase
MRLGVNVDHIATIREARKTFEPDPANAIGVVERAGASGIVCHLREDRRHINDRDLAIIRKLVGTHLNLEMAATDDMVRIAIETSPDMVTLVPERREEVTTEGGLDVVGNSGKIRDYITQLKSHGIVVSLFIDPELEVIKESKRVDADFIELHTGAYANKQNEREQENEALRIRDMAIAATKLGLRVSAGHGLTYHNVDRIVEIKEIEELNIGHSIMARAIFDGLDKAVRDMLDIIAV